jgi:hypothetical protein
MRTASSTTPTADGRAAAGPAAPRRWPPLPALPWRGAGALPAEVTRRARRMAAGDAGMSTAEYAIGTIAAAAFGAILYTVVTGDSIVTALTNIINRALNTNV